MSLECRLILESGEIRKVIRDDAATQKGYNACVEECKRDTMGTHDVSTTGMQVGGTR